MAVLKFKKTFVEGTLKGLEYEDRITFANYLDLKTWKKFEEEGKIITDLFGSNKYTVSNVRLVLDD